MIGGNVLNVLRARLGSRQQHTLLTTATALISISSQRKV